MQGLSPRQATVAGTAAVAVVTVALLLLGDAVAHATQALLLVLPVAGTALVGGRRPALWAAGIATLMFTLVLPPVGSLRIRFAEDVVALAVFSAVGFLIGGLVGHRIQVLGDRDRQRAALLRSVSHDLRTPLTTIRVAVSELQDGGPYDDAHRARLLAHVGDEAERLDRLVANLLSLARIEGGGLHPRLQAVDLPELVDACVQRLGRVLDGTDVRVSAANDVPTLLADHMLLGQVVTNLLENAARHSPAGTPVDVAVRTSRRTVELVVADHGPGVPAEEVAAVFEPFRTGGATAGTGIGLAICKAVVEAHGGTIAVGDSPGGGARFTVRLPVR